MYKFFGHPVFVENFCFCGCIRRSFGVGISGSSELSSSVEVEITLARPYTWQGITTILVHLDSGNDLLKGVRKV